MPYMRLKKYMQLKPGLKSFAWLVYACCACIVYTYIDAIKEIHAAETWPEELCMVGICCCACIEYVCVFVCVCVNAYIHT